MGAEFLLGVLALLITQLFPRQIIGLFGSESELYNEFAVMTFRVYLCMLPLATVNKATGAKNFIVNSRVAWGRVNSANC